MPTYGVRVEFRAPPSAELLDDFTSVQIELPDANGSVQLKKAYRNDKRRANYYALVGSGFSSENEARRIGSRLRNALIVCGVVFRLGLDVGQDGPGSICELIGDKIVCMERSDGPGVWVYEEDPEKAPFAAILGIGRGIDSDKFVQQFKTRYTDGPALNSKLGLAFELYNSSHFDPAPRTRFITLISSIESLVTCGAIHHVAINHLSWLTALSKDAINSLLRERKMAENLTLQQFQARLASGDLQGWESGEVKQVLEMYFLLERFHQLKRESISNACRKLVAEHLGTKEVKDFNWFYATRGKLLHEGEVPKGVKLDVEVYRLDGFVQRLLIAAVNADTPKTAEQDP